MKAAVYHHYGPPEVVQIEDVPRPNPKANELLIRIRATTVAAADWRMRKADPSLVRIINGLTEPRKTTILGMEFAGVVEAVGATVSRFHAGDEVFGSTGFKFGTHAEYVCAAEDQVALKPANMPLEESAAVLFGGISALHFLREGQIEAGQKVLIYGASGSVGVFAVQLAKHFGADVTAVCSTGNFELVKSLGADRVIDYTKQDFSADGPVYDMVFDSVGYSGFDRSLRALKRGGHYVRVGGSGKLAAILVSVVQGLWASLTGRAKVIGGVAQGSPRDFALLKQLIEAGELKTVIDRRYTLGEIAEAHRYAEAGHKKGHVLILFEPQPVH